MVLRNENSAVRACANARRVPLMQAEHILASCGCCAGRTWGPHSCTRSHSAPRNSQIHWSSIRIPKSCFHLHLHSRRRHKSFHLKARRPKGNKNTEFSSYVLPITESWGQEACQKPAGAAWSLGVGSLYRWWGAPPGCGQRRAGPTALR